MTILSESNDFFIRFPEGSLRSATGYQWINPPDCQWRVYATPEAVAYIIHSQKGGAGLSQVRRVSVIIKRFSLSQL